MVPRGRDLRLLVVGNAVSTLGNSVYLIAVTLLLKDLTGSALVLGVFQFLALSPAFILSPVTGALIDRNSRRTVIVLSDALRGALMVGAGLLLTVPVFRSPWLVLPVALLAGVGHAFFVPAAQALVPSLVPPERLQSANGLRAATTQAANLVGNAVGGVLYVAIGAPAVFVINGLSFLVSAWRETAIRPDAVATGGGRVAVAAAAREGLGLLGSRRRLRLLVGSQAGLFVLSPALMLALPFLVIDDLGLGRDTLGYFFAAALGGGIVAFLTLNRMPARVMVRRPVPPVAYALLTASLILVTVRTSWPTLAAAAVVTGAAAGLVYLYAVTWIQHCTDPALHGRMFAILEAASSLVAPVSYLVAGAALDASGAEYRWIVFGVMAILAATWTGVLTARWGAREDRGPSPSSR